MDCAPHLERMLWDNAQLARVYLHAWQITGNEFFRTIAEKILDNVMREMLAPEGEFHSTQDADSEGEEGKFFVWKLDEIREVLGDEAEAFIVAYGVTLHGNFEGENILEFVGDMDQRPALSDARRKLFEAREQRVQPGRDQKVLTSWNDLMLAAFAEAARVLGRHDYQEVARRSAEFLLRELRQENGRLVRTWKQGEAKLNGWLEDFGHLIEGLLELYQITFAQHWFVAVQELAETMLEHFVDSGGTPYDTSDDHEALITRPRDLQDDTTPSGNAMAVITLKLAGFTNDMRTIDIVVQALAQMRPMMNQYPFALGQWLQALVYALSKPREIAIVSAADGAYTNAMLNVFRGSYQPIQVLAQGVPSTQSPACRTVLILATSRQFPGGRYPGQRHR